MSKLLMENGLPMDSKVIVADLVQIPDGPRSLWDLAAQLESGNLEPPLHQRKADAWDAKKKKAWIDRCNLVLTGHPTPLGIVCIYQLREAGAKQYLNEGLQRISAALEAKLAPKDYGYEPSEIEKVLTLTYLHVQNRIYKSHKEAVLDYRAVNNGTVLQPIEHNKAEYLYNDKWPAWRLPFDQWHSEIEQAIGAFSQTSDRRHARLNRERQEKQIFSVGCSGGPVRYGRDSKLEECVSKCLDDFAPSKMDDLIRKMRNYSAEICKAWRESEPGKHYAEKMHGSLARWCLGAMFLYQDIRPEWWQPFLMKLFGHTGGNAIFPYTSAQGRAKTLTLASRLENFGAVCKELAINIPEQARRPKSRKRLAPGFQADHTHPFADFGDGETQPLPARLNAAKNARRIMQDSAQSAADAGSLPSAV